MRKGENAKQTIIQRIRKRVHCTIDPENYEYLENNCLNASRLLDKAIYELRKIKSSALVLISENKEKEWTRWESNPRSPPCQGDVIAY